MDFRVVAHLGRVILREIEVPAHNAGDVFGPSCGDAYWEVLASEADPFEPPVRTVTVLAEPCSAEPDARAGINLEI